MNITDLPLASGANDTDLYALDTSSGDTKRIAFSTIKSAILTSPVLSGTPTATTPASSDNSTKLATTEFVNEKVANALSVVTSSATYNASYIGTILKNVVEQYGNVVHVNFIAQITSDLPDAGLSIITGLPKCKNGMMFVPVCSYYDTLKTSYISQGSAELIVNGSTSEIKQRAIGTDVGFYFVYDITYMAE